MGTAEAAFEGGKWGHRPRPRSFDKKKPVFYKQKKFLLVIKKLNSCAKSWNLT